MDVKIKPRRLGGNIGAIASKSRAHRLLICAALSDAGSHILCNTSSEDIDATARCLSALGGKVQRTCDGFLVEPIGERDGTAEIDCGESGSTLRFILPVIGALGKKARIKLSGRLPERPLSPLWEELTGHGMHLSWEKEDVILCEGQLKSGTYTLPADISSQFISGLLFALPLISGDSTLCLTGKIESANYIKMTEEAVKTYGITFTYTEKTYKIPGGQRMVCPEGKTVQVEGDWSNAAFWLSGGTLGGGVTCTGLSPDSLQGDKEIVTLLKAFGAACTYDADAVTLQPVPLRGIDIDAAQIPDLVPILAVIAAAAEGETRIFGAQRLRMKESDRLESVAAMLSSLGGEVQITEDGLRIFGGKPLSGGEVDSAGDHRIAMAAAIATTLCQSPVTIKGAEAVNKSYPTFWEDFIRLGGELERSHAK